jgi:hypothetical protein
MIVDFSELESQFALLSKPISHPPLFHHSATVLGTSSEVKYARMNTNCLSVKM